ncbi:MAG: hypothetical protein JST76_02815 [Bacteroidetes bacterium]|nr:hypothetical protein [Bacteroidota bacterium]
MKKLITLATLILMTAAASHAATNASKPNPQLAERNIVSSIRSQIQFPEYLKEVDGEHDATIIFKVNSCGTITVQEVQCDEEDLRRNLLSQVAGFHVDASYLDSHDTYKVVVRFKTL